MTTYCSLVFNGAIRGSSVPLVPDMILSFIRFVPSGCSGCGGGGNTNGCCGMSGAEEGLWRMPAGGEKEGAGRSE